jgi:hypothetical protein
MLHDAPQQRHLTLVEDSAAANGPFVKLVLRKACVDLLHPADGAGWPALQPE